MTESLVETLEEIRTVAIAYIQERKIRNWEIYLEELRRGPAIVFDKEARIGVWIFDPTNLVLKRDSEIVVPITIRYGMVFEKDDQSNFIVKEDFLEKESFSR